MYFLAKNIRTCSKSYKGIPDKYRLYENGVLNWEYLAKNISYFITHPEQIKQKLKERDAHMLCRFFDSEEYKAQVTQFLETQGRIISKDTGIKPPGSVKYQHVLSCAQPTHKKAKIIVDGDEELQTRAGEDGPKKRRIKRGTIFEEMMKRRGKVPICEDSDCATIKNEVKPKQFRHKSTIMPIFLKKIRQRRLEEEEQQYEEEESQSLPYVNFETARKMKKETDESEKPLYAQILHKSQFCNKNAKMPGKKRVSSTDMHEASGLKDAGKPNFSTRQEFVYLNPKNFYEPPLRYKSSSPIKTDSAPPPVRFKLSSYNSENAERPSLKTASTNDDKSPNKSKLNHSSYRPNKGSSTLEDATLKLGPSPKGVPLRMASSTAKYVPKAPTIKLCPRKNMNQKTYFDFLCVEAVKPRTYKKETPVENSDAKSVKIKVLKVGGKESKTKKKNCSIQKLMDQVHKNRSLKALKFEYNLEKQNTMRRIIRNQEGKQSKEGENDELRNNNSSLFNKVKLGTAKKDTSSPTNTSEIRPDCFLETSIIKPEIIETPKETKDKFGLEQESFTYKVVAKSRERKEARLRAKFKANPSCWPYKFDFSANKSQSDLESRELETTSLKNQLVNNEGTMQGFGVLSRNIPTNLHRPVPHFVEHADRPKSVEFNKYLIRLPKTTPEGHRVLLYSVRDPDPTKMNFNDVVKGFCMYNDCILSEDGLQEGYIVIFDMRDVCIGHLARVSLPALKCFMYYIQDAHPCRIKQIHVLNTASWIQHVMRLVVPLVRSELLNLVKFHKGNVPEGLPIEILPMDYGGEAPTVEELDITTKSLLEKYHDWLIESEQFKADESKRVKKAGWWGLFSSKSPQQVELDEKTILKNLQID